MYSLSRAETKLGTVYFLPRAECEYCMFLIPNWIWIGYCMIPISSWIWIKSAVRSRSRAKSDLSIVYSLSPSGSGVLYIPDLELNLSWVTSALRGFPIAPWEIIFQCRLVVYGTHWNLTKAWQYACLLKSAHVSCSPGTCDGSVWSRHQEILQGSFVLPQTVELGNPSGTPECFS